MDLWGKSYTRRDLESYMGDLRQLADIRLVTLDDGQERGVRAAQVRTGSGLDFTVLLDRAMDIGVATYNGIPLAWQSGIGAAHPSRYEPEGLGWLHTFHGGLLALCGLTHVGAPTPSIDPETNEHLGLHGRIGTIPAADIHVERDWDAETPILRLHGVIDETVLFGYKLRLTRTIEFEVGQSAIRIHDRVRNMGGVPAPLMLLYHCNFGFPIVSPDSHITMPATGVIARDAAAQSGLGEWASMGVPTRGYAEQVFFHEVPRSEEIVTASIFNPSINVGVAVDFHPNTLSNLTEWKQMGFGDYTVGIEPGNCLPEGRVSARENGRLRMLPPGETDEFDIGFRVLTAQEG